MSDTDAWNAKMERDEKVRREVQAELLGGIKEYVELFEDSSCLDGYFSSTDLRRIANAMDEIRRRL